MSQLGAYLDFIGSGPDAGMTPDDLVAEGLSNPDKAKSRLMKWYNWIQGGVVEGYSPWTRDDEPRKVSQSTAVTYVGRLRGFYTHNKVVFGKWKMPSRETGRTREADSQLDVFRFDEENGEIYVDNPLLQQFMAHLNFRDQTIALAVYSTSQDAVDLFKLTLGWLRRQDKESRLFWEGNRVKTGEPFKVFFSREATEFTRRYAAQERAGAGDDEPIWVKGREYDITLNDRTYGVGGPMEPSALNFNFRRAAEEMGLTVPEQPNPMRPKRFRHLFRTACTSAGLDPGVSQGFMGHATPVSARYLSQGKAFLLSQYVIIEPFLTVFKSRGEIDVQSIRADLNAVRRERDEIRSALDKFQSENSDLKDGLGELDRRVKVAEGDRARLEGEVTALRDEVEYVKNIAVELVGKYRVMKEIAPEVWEEVERKTVAPEVLKKAEAERRQRLKEEFPELLAEAEETTTRKRKDA